MGDLLGGITGTIGGIIGNSDRDRATKGYQDMLNSWKGLNPNVAAPDIAQGDPRTQAIQNQVLQQALQRARAGGLNAVDMGRLNAIRSNQAQQTKAGQAAAMSEAQQRGVANGNTGIMGAMMAGQAAADQGANQAMQAGAIGQESQNQANQQAAQQAGGLRGQNIGVEQGNIQRKMQQANQNKMNEYGQLQGESGVQSDLSQQQIGNAQNTANQWRGAGQAVGSIWDDTFGKNGLMGMGKGK
jgi:hypothetical protein